MSLYFSENENIIDKDYDELVYVFLENPIHEVYESGLGISQAKRHKKKLIMSIPLIESWILNVWLLDSKSMIPKSYVIFQKTCDPITTEISNLYAVKDSFALWLFCLTLDSLYRGASSSQRVLVQLMKIY